MSVPFEVRRGAAAILQKMKNGEQVTSWDLQSLALAFSANTTMIETNAEGDVDPSVAALTFVLLLMAHA
jgi:hypothetical protein